MMNAIGELHTNIEGKSAIVTYNQLPTVEVLPFQIQQLFTNIIGNSLRYSKADSPPKINIKSEMVKGDTEDLLPADLTEKFYKFTFTDNGIGFEPEYSEKIFELFSRLHGKLEYEGTGIGLAICKKLWKIMVDLFLEMENQMKVPFYTIHSC